jgi:hypothetical protein
VAAWVGQAVDLRSTVFGPPVANPFGPNPTFSWTVQDKTVGNWTADTNASHETPITGELTKAEPKVYWVNGGAKQVRVTVTRPNQAPIAASGKITIKRPNANARGETDRVRIHPAPPFGKWMAELGGRFDPNAQNPKPYGIVFTMTKDATAPAGDYQWVQLTKYRLTHEDSVNKRWTAKTPGYVLDTKYPYTNDEVPNDLPDPENQVSDSPHNDFGYDIPGATPPFIGSSRDDRFEMYLMWNPFLDDDGIFVPLRVIFWNWNYDAHMQVIDGVTQWPYTAFPPAGMTFPSQDITAHPNWTANVLAYLNEYTEEQ